MNQAVPASQAFPAASPQREWRAELELGFATRAGKSALMHALHRGPLRVQRPFFPEQDGSLHLYLLHPPGGLVLGDYLSIRAEVADGARVLLTTPGAGRFYSVAESAGVQQQIAELHLAGGTSLEWLPQETIVFDGADANILTRLHCAADSTFCAWDVVVLGRPAANESFTRGRCRQRLEILREGKLVFREFNALAAGSPALNARWGLRGCSTFGTLVANVVLPRAERETLADALNQQWRGQFSITQRDDLLLARYLGPCAAAAKEGFMRIWEMLRPVQLNKPAVRPRIWQT